MSSSGGSGSTRGKDGRIYSYDDKSKTVTIRDSGGTPVARSSIYDSKGSNKSSSSNTYSNAFNNAGVVNMRDYMSSLGQTPGWDAATGMVTIGGKQYQSGNIPGTYLDASTGYNYVTDPTKFDSLLSPSNTTQNVIQPIMPPPEKEEEFQFMMPEFPAFDMSMYEMPAYDTSGMISGLAEAQRAARIAALDKAKGQALAALDTEKDTIAPIYYDKRNQAAAQSDVGAMNFAQYMAARGIKGAAGAMPEIYRNASLQGQLGALDRQEGAQLGAIERQRANIEAGYASDVAAANAAIEAQAMQANIDQYNTDRAYQMQAMQNAINQYNAERDYMMQQAALEWEIKRANQERQKAAEDAARQEWLTTIGRYADDYQAQINAVQNDGDPSNDWQIPYLQAARQNKISDLEAAAAKAAQQDFENQLALARLNKSSGGGSSGTTKTPTSIDQRATQRAISQVWSYGSPEEAIAAYKYYGADMATDGVDLSKVWAEMVKRWPTYEAFRKMEDYEIYT